MKGQTGAPATDISIRCNSKDAIDERQQRLKQETAHLWINPKVGTTHTLIKGQRRMQRLNDLNRGGQEMEMAHTLVKDGIVPVRHQMMTRAKARKLNTFNWQNGLKLKWMLGKQELK